MLLQEIMAKHGKNFNESNDQLKAERRNLLDELTDQRRMLDILRKERIDLESEVHRLRLSKEQTERKLKWFYNYS